MSLTSASSSHQLCDWVDQHGDALLRYALSRLSDRDAAEDCVQETLLAALKGKDSFKGDSAPLTWLVGILRHKILDHHRKAGSRGVSYDSSNGDEDSSVDDWFARDGHWRKFPKTWDQDPAQLSEQAEFQRVLDDCLKAVPGKAGEAFALRAIGDVPAEEVCKVLEISATHFWVLLHRARTRLRACLELKWFGRSPVTS